LPYQQPELGTKQETIDIHLKKILTQPLGPKKTFSQRDIKHPPKRKQSHGTVSFASQGKKKSFRSPKPAPKLIPTLSLTQPPSRTPRSPITKQEAITSEGKTEKFAPPLAIDEESVVPVKIKSNCSVMRTPSQNKS